MAQHSRQSRQPEGDQDQERRCRGHGISRRPEDRLEPPRVGVQHRGWDDQPEQQERRRQPPPRDEIPLRFSDDALRDPHRVRTGRHLKTEAHQPPGDQQHQPGQDGEVPAEIPDRRAQEEPQRQGAAEELRRMIEISHDPRSDQGGGGRVDRQPSPPRAEAGAQPEQAGQRERRHHDHAERVRIDKGRQAERVDPPPARRERSPQPQQHPPAEDGHQDEPGVHPRLARIDDQHRAERGQPGGPQSRRRIEGGPAEREDEPHGRDPAGRAQRPCGDLRRAEGPGPPLEQQRVERCPGRVDPEEQVDQRGRAPRTRQPHRHDLVIPEAQPAELVSAQASGRREDRGQDRPDAPGIATRAGVLDPGRPAHRFAFPASIRSR